MDEDPPRRPSGQRLDETHDHERRISELERGAVVLFGHGGQPGALTVMNAEQGRHGQRIEQLEQARWKLAGAVMLAGSLTGVVLFALAHLFK